MDTKDDKNTLQPPSFTEIVFHVGESAEAQEEIPVSIGLLREKSTVIRNLYDKNGLIEHISLADIHPEDFGCFIDFIEIGTIGRLHDWAYDKGALQSNNSEIDADLAEENANVLRDIWSIANDLGVPSLKVYLIDILYNIITSHNEFLYVPPRMPASTIIGLLNAMYTENDKAPESPEMVVGGLLKRIEGKEAYVEQLKDEVRGPNDLHNALLRDILVGVLEWNFKMTGYDM